MIRIRFGLRSFFLQVNTFFYAPVRRLMFQTMTAQDAHDRATDVAALADRSPLLMALVDLGHRMAFAKQPTLAGGVTLDYPLMLAAGFVKGKGFPDEATALAAVERGDNIIPGWRSVPKLVGLVEFGSFTRWPRMGNPGTVVWRDVRSWSTQNRVGLKNPGVKAAAAFLSRHQNHLPPQFGINIAVSPGVDDPEQEQQDVLESISAFFEKGIFPTWFTLNLSCPNTEDDPDGNQTESKARTLCAAVIEHLKQRAPHPIPLWVKIGPNLADEQYMALLRAFVDTGVSAIVGTNTLPEPAPNDPSVNAGVGGGRLHMRAVEVIGLLMMEKVRQNYAIDVIGCGGILDGKTYYSFKTWGVDAAQYWSALIYRGPLAAAMIVNEV